MVQAVPPWLDGTRDLFWPSATKRVRSPVASATGGMGKLPAVAWVQVRPSARVRKRAVTIVFPGDTSLRKKFSWTKRTGLLGEVAFWARTRGSHHVAPSGEEKTRSDPAVAVLTTKVPRPEETPLRGPRVRPVSATANLNGGMRALGPDTTARRRKRRRRRSRTGACRRETRTEPQATS